MGSLAFNTAEGLIREENVHAAFAERRDVSALL